MEVRQQTLQVASKFGAVNGSSAIDDSDQYLTLRLGTEEYAIDILQVQEIRSYEEPTRMVNAPLFIKGIVDLRIKLELTQVDYTVFTVVIILNLGGSVIGAVVDAVSDVLTLPATSIKPAPQFQTSIDSRFVTGLATLDQRTIIVMDVEALLSGPELGMAKHVAWS
jgi:purine-binding chemotaxis protein CheW